MDDYRALCEVCETPIPDGQEVVHPEEGDSYCAKCVVALLGQERDVAQQQLAGAVDALRGVLMGCVILDETENGDPILLDVRTDPATPIILDRLGGR